MQPETIHIHQANETTANHQELVLKNGIVVCASVALEFMVGWKRNQIYAYARNRGWNYYSTLYD